MQTVAVIFGGRSAEHDVSVVTALSNIIKPLELTNKYNVEAIYISKDGAWYSDERLKDIRLYTSDKIKDFIKTSQPVSVRFDSGMTVLKQSKIGRKSKRIDIAFPSMHGTYGEDGALMGMLDMAGIPYVGCGLSTAAVAMDKALAKQVASANNIPVSKFATILKPELSESFEKVVSKIAKDLQFPLFVKPTHLGSSIGISRVTNEIELRNGLEVAAHYDDKIIVEEAVQNLIEVTLPIIGNETLQLALLEQPMTQAEDFFDFETKYMQGGGKNKGASKSGAKGSQGYSKIPADLPKPIYEKAEALGLKVYKSFGCSGIARIDMLIDQKTSEVYFNEINPLPGGLYAHNWNKAGLSNVNLVQKLVDLAEARAERRDTLNTTFSTNYLRQF